MVMMSVYAKRDIEKEIETWGLVDGESLREL